MIQIVIFSYNRALQLEALLRSLDERWKSPDYHVDVLYNCSSEFFQQGYDRLTSQCSDKVSFHKETKNSSRYCIGELLNPRNLKHYIETASLRNPRSNFRSLLIGLLERNTAQHVLFLTDDSNWIHDVALSTEALDWLDADPDHRQYVLRLGRELQDKPTSVTEEASHLSWRFSQHPFVSSWGYPFSVDAHIYDKRLVLRYFQKYIFANPNTLEGVIADRMRAHHEADEARGVLSPLLLSFPINMVQNEADNASCQVSCELLNQKFLDGYTLEYPLPTVITAFQNYPDHLIFRRDGKQEELAIGKPTRH